MIPKVVASEIGAVQTLKWPYGLTARVMKGVACLHNFYAEQLIHLTVRHKNQQRKLSG